MERQPQAARGDAAANRSIKIIRLPEVVARTGHSRTVIYEKLKRHEFPQSVALGERAIGFVEHEIDEYLTRLIDSSRKVAA